MTKKKQGRFRQRETGQKWAEPVSANTNTMWGITKKKQNRDTRYVSINLFEIASRKMSRIDKLDITCWFEKGIFHKSAVEILFFFLHLQVTWCAQSFSSCYCGKCSRCSGNAKLRTMMTRWWQKRCYLPSQSVETQCFIDFYYISCEFDVANTEAVWWL